MKSRMTKESLPIRMGVLMADPENPFWTEMESCYERLASSMGVETSIVWPKTGRDLDHQLEILRGMLNGAFDLVVINPLSPENLVPGILEAAMQKLPVLDVGAKTDMEMVRKAGDLYIPLRTVDFQEQGRLAGGFLAREIEASGQEPAGVVIMAGREDAAQSKGRCEGAVGALLSRDKAFELIRAQGGFERKQGEEAAKRIVSRRRDVQGFFCANDLMALGVADALETTPGSSRALVVGVDGIPEAIEAVKNGRMAATVAFRREDVARAVLTAATQYLSGGDITEVFTVTSRLVTSPK